MKSKTFVLNLKKFFEEYLKIKDVWKGRLQNYIFNIHWLTKSRTDTKKSLISRLFLLYLDAPYRDLERTFILRAIKNIEI